MDCLGIDIGLISVKATMLHEGREQWTEMVDHEGNIPEALLSILDRHGVDGAPLALTTGNAGRNHVNTEKAIPPQAIEAGLAAIGEFPDAVISLGGESIVVYTMGEGALTQEALTGDKCAAGTGEFFRQQLMRMDLDLSVLDSIPEETEPKPLSSRCSVFMKSDCTHKLNKREATKEEIVVSLADVMASKVTEFLTRARVDKGRILLIGGVSRNRFVRKYLAERMPEIQFVTPEQAAYFEAFGAAHLAASHGEPLPPRDRLMDTGAITFERYDALAESADLVTRATAEHGVVEAGREYVLGIDGGSTTTKAVLVDVETHRICASHYGRTHGDPVEALRRVLIRIREQVRDAIGDEQIQIKLASTTGSSREVLGVFVETPGIYNEIIAHTVGTTHFQPDIDTIFEIGGQDAKYVFLKNGVPIDYAMNEACSAGTGSFLEESAAGDLNILTAPEIGPIAMESTGPLRFGEHCSAFINSDIRKAVQEGAGKADIMAGIVFSIVSNYLNRVVGNRNIGGNIVLQGGVAKNPAVPVAFAAMLKKPILVPPDPELLGAFGVALLALQKRADGLLDDQELSLDELIARPIAHGRTFNCKTCDNLCPIQTLIVGEAKRRYHFGGRCDQYANLRRRKKIDLDKIGDFVALRQQMLFTDYAPDPKELRPTTDAVVGVPRVFAIHSIWPLVSWFFHDLGVRTRLSDKNVRQGVQRAEAAYCLPGEIAHGMTEQLQQEGVDYFFFPHLLDMESMQDDVWATLCPITQGMPYYLRPAFQIPDSKILRPVISFAGGYSSGSAPFIELAERLGFTAEEGLRAFRVGVQQQLAFQRHAVQIGGELLRQAEESDEVVVALFGRPYNAFAREANMGIPRKLLTRGYRVVPFDFFPISDEQITDNMYWYYGQQNLKAARMVKQHPNIYMCCVSNFGCAPDSFILHFMRWIMGTKPYLVLEMDSHTADAGIDTRVEAFLDIVSGYREKAAEMKDRSYHKRFEVVMDGPDTHVLDHDTGEQMGFDHPRVRVLWPSMGNLAAQAISAVARQLGINAEHLPPADRQTTQLARSVASGKECVPTLMVLGQVLKLMTERPPEPDQVLVVFVPKTTGPCRTGQYAPFFELTFADLGFDNICILNLSSDNSYTELGSGMSGIAWYSLVLPDYFKDIQLALRLTARDLPAATETFDDVWGRLVQIQGDDIGGLFPYLESEGVPRLRAIDRKADLASFKRVIVVGEIYVRRDDFSIHEIEDHLLQNGIFPKFTGVGEWISYTDHSASLQLEQRLQKRHTPWYRRPFDADYQRWAGLKVEQFFMRAIEERIAETLEPAGLTVPFPSDMREILADVERFTDISFETEATVSPMTASLAVEQGYDGIILIAPFACLPGRLIKAMLEPYTRERNVPFIALEADGLKFPPNVISRLEIFMLNVLRRGQPDAAGEQFQRMESPG